MVTKLLESGCLCLKPSPFIKRLPLKTVKNFNAKILPGHPACGGHPAKSEEAERYKEKCNF
jgi:hypothetical protein